MSMKFDQVKLKANKPWQFFAMMFICLLISGCQIFFASPTQKLGDLSLYDSDCQFPVSKNDAPKWICGTPVEGVSLQAVGSAARSSGNPGTREASTLAKEALGDLILTRLETSSSSDATLEANQRKQAIQAAINQHAKLISTRIDRPGHKQYVLMGLTEPELKAILLDSGTPQDSIDPLTQHILAPHTD